MVAVELDESIKEKARIPKEAKKILHALASDWSDVADSRDLQVMPMKGAMTNEVYQIKWLTEGKSRKVLVRIYGEGVDVFFDREDEIRTFECMLRHGQGPRLLGRFPNGCVEEFINAEVSWPLDLTANAEALKKYNQVVAFLLKVKRAKYVLDKARKWMWKIVGGFRHGSWIQAVVRGFEPCWVDSRHS